VVVVRTMCFQTAGNILSACIIATSALCRRTHVLEAKELVAAIGAQRAGIRQQLLQRRGLERVGVLLRDRVARGWAGRGLQRRQYVPWVPLPAASWRRGLTAPDLRRPKNELMVTARSDGRAEQWGAGEVLVVQAAQGRAHAARA
jgi:hypothetical protein